MSMVRYKPEELPTMSEQRKAEFMALAELPDSDIDYSDIPPLGEAFWQKAAPSPFRKAAQTPTPVPLDSDVLAWLKSQGKDYQQRINAILREAMLHARQSEA